MAETPLNHSNYGYIESNAYANDHMHDKSKKTFQYPVVRKFLEAEAPGKKVLDIACGPGYWCREAAECGAKSVDGFDIQEEMVQLARQATSQYSSVKISVGDVKNMPYDDNTFDVAISLYATCNTPMKTMTRHFEELCRVLVPGGKALVLNLSGPVFEKVFTLNNIDEAVVRKKIEELLQKHSDLTSVSEMNKAFQGLEEVVTACFARDDKGSLFLINDIHQLTNGQEIWGKTQFMIFPNYFYSDKYLMDETLASGLCVDAVENTFTEDRRMAYNLANPNAQLSKTFTEHPPILLYYLSKPTVSQ